MAASFSILRDIIAQLANKDIQGPVEAAALLVGMAGQLLDTESTSNKAVAPYSMQLRNIAKKLAMSGGMDTKTPGKPTDTQRK